MSDYLGTLVDRTFGFAPVVQPRLRAMHEPAQQTDEPRPLIETTESPAPEPSRRVVERAPAVTPADPRAASLPPPHARETPPPPPVTVSQHELLVPREIVVKQRSRVAVDHASAPPPPALRETLEPTAVHRASEASPSSASSPPAGPTPPLAPPLAAAGDATPPIMRGRDPERAPAAPVPGTGVVPVSRIRPRTTQPASSSPVAPHLRAPASEVRHETPGAPPAIHVTIGRVEVRAVVDSRTAPRRAAPAARESLEDYLKSRGGGKARP